MKRIGLVKASTLQPFIRFLAQNGIDLDPHFRGAHISPDLILQEDSWLPKQQVYRFLSDVASANELEALGLIVGDQICVADLGTLGKEIYRCRTLKSACLRFCELVPQIAEGNTASSTTHGETTWFSYQTLDHRAGNRDHADHYGLMMLLSVVRLVAGHWYPTEVSVQTAPCDAFLRHPAWKNTRVTFGEAATGLAFPSAWNRRPIPDPPEMLAADPPTPPYPSNPPETLTRSLEIILAAYLHFGGVPSVERVADSLNMSERTLKRRLADEGNSYSQLVDQVRIQAAETLLNDPALSIKDIAYRLGYSGPNNLIRSFRRIRGTTPGAWRQASR